MGCDANHSPKFLVSQKVEIPMNEIREEEKWKLPSRPSGVLLAVTARFSRGVAPKEVVLLPRTKSGTYRIQRTDTGEIKEIGEINKA